MAATLHYSDTDLTLLERSAAMAPLSADAVRQLLEDLHTLHAQRAELRRLLDEVAPHFRSAREQLQQVLKLVS